MKIGLVDAGGGFRGIYGWAVQDYCLEHEIYFDYCIGVSAGSANLISYMARQKGRNIPFYGEYGFRKEYCSVSNFLRDGNYLNLNYVYGTLSNSDGEYPLDYQAIVDNPAEYYAVATNAVTGKVFYFDRSYLSQDHYEIVMASSALPGACHPVKIGDNLYFDGGFGDPVPVQKALDDGCDKVVLILTKTRDTIRKPGADNLGVSMIRHRYPEAAKQLSLRYKKYNDAVVLAKEYEKQGKVLIISPESTLGMTTLKRSQEQLDQMYQMGLEDAKVIPEFLAR